MAEECAAGTVAKLAGRVGKGASKAARLLRSRRYSVKVKMLRKGPCPAALRLPPGAVFLLAMYDARTRQALDEATGDFSTTHLTLNPSSSALNTLQHRLISAGGWMFLADMTAAAHLAQNLLIYRGYLELKFGIDLKLYCQSLLPQQLVLFYASRVTSFGPFYIRSAQDARDLHDAQPSLDARLDYGSGTYLVCVECAGPRGPPFPNRFVKYVGESGNIARRQRDHIGEIRKIQKAHDDGNFAIVKAATDVMGVLYQERVLDHWQFKLAYAPPTDKQQASELHQAISGRLFPNAELQLKEMGSSRCKESQDRFEFTNRIVRYVDEHTACDHIEIVDGEGYEDLARSLGVSSADLSLAPTRACQRRALRERGEAFASVDDEDETQAIVEEGALNAIYDYKIDYVRYVEELPSSEGSQQHEWQRWCVDLEAREVPRKPPLCMDDTRRDEIWELFHDGSFQCTYKEGVLRVKLHPRLSAYDIKLDWNMQEGAATVGFEFHLKEELSV